MIWFKPSKKETEESANLIDGHISKIILPENDNIPKFGEIDAPPPAQNQSFEHSISATGSQQTPSTSTGASQSNNAGNNASLNEQNPDVDEDFVNDARNKNISNPSDPNDLNTSSKKRQKNPSVLFVAFVFCKRNKDIQKKFFAF